jgi:hypothetical protein
MKIKQTAAQKRQLKADLAAYESAKAEAAAATQKAARLESQAWQAKLDAESARRRAEAAAYQASPEAIAARARDALSVAAMLEHEKTRPARPRYEQVETAEQTRAREDAEDRAREEGAR